MHQHVLFRDTHPWLSAWYPPRLCRPALTLHLEQLPATTCELPRAGDQLQLQTLRGEQPISLLSDHAETSTSREVHGLDQSARILHTPRRNRLTAALQLTTYFAARKTRSVCAATITARMRSPCSSKEMKRDGQNSGRKPLKMQTKLKSDEHESPTRNAPAAFAPCKRTRDNLPSPLLTLPCPVHTLGLRALSSYKAHLGPRIDTTAISAVLHRPPVAHVHVVPAHPPNCNYGSANTLPLHH